ncbi:cell differentiation protein rcd1-like [Cynara cardunculus var. scolymus]|uniref:cell differentiation protein rcd1-like n=1 Tax=Cynara cardunculus var. scolymus TaxID=59895 RepID=UPI000D62575B|nr:cell differentiation protein rcd1-like [Cynara cardunculus var. scolymus]
MENLPESLYVDPREVASSSSSTTQWNTTQSFSATDRPGIEQLIKLLNRPQTRAEAINQLNRVSKIYKCIASHPEARMGCIKAQMPVYIYPFLNTTEQQLVQFDYLRINSLGVIATLVKVLATPTTSDVCLSISTMSLVP